MGSSTGLDGSALGRVAFSALRSRLEVSLTHQGKVRRLECKPLGTPALPRPLLPAESRTVRRARRDEVARFPLHSRFGAHYTVGAPAVTTKQKFRSLQRRHARGALNRLTEANEELKPGAISSFPDSRAGAARRRDESLSQTRRETGTSQSRIYSRYCDRVHRKLHLKLLKFILSCIGRDNTTPRGGGNGLIWQKLM